MALNAPLRILIVEDHDDSRDALQRLLERQDHFVFGAGTIAEALALANALALDLVIADLGLPDGDGCDLMRTLRETRGLPGIAVSGHVEDEHRQRVHRAGFSVHLCKPIAFQQLADAIEKCLADPGPR